MKAANDKHYIDPLWVRCAHTIWAQDECAPDAETGDEAWQRLFGEPLDTDKAIDSIDCGDEFGWLMPNGHVFWNSYCGHSIARAAIVAVLP